MNFKRLFPLILIVLLLLSNTALSQKLAKKESWPYIKKSTFNISSFDPYSFGYVLSNLEFVSKTSLRIISSDKKTQEPIYGWDFSVKFNCDIVGYKYFDKIYSKKELIEIVELAGYSKETIQPILKDVKFTFFGYQADFLNYVSIGSLNFGSFPFHKNDEIKSPNVEVDIIGNKRDLYLESIIEKYLKNKDKNKKGKSTYGNKGVYKKSTSEGKLIIKGNTDNKTIKSDEEVDVDNGAIQRRLAKYRKEEAERKKREFEKSRRKVERDLGRVFSSGISSLVEGGGTLKFVYGIRTIEDPQPSRSPLGASTLEIGAGFGRIGFSLGYSLIDNQDELNKDTDSRRDRASGGTWAFGLDLTIFKFRFLGSRADFGINGEYGIGNLEYKVTTSTNQWTTDYSTNFYGIGAQLRFFEFLYVTYCYGKFTTDETRNTTSGSSVLDPVDGFYTKLGFGIKYDFD